MDALPPPQLDLVALRKAVRCYREPIEHTDGVARWYFDEVTPAIVLSLLDRIEELERRP